MQDFLSVADKIPWLMAPATVIVALIVIAVLVLVNRLLAPASKAMLVAVMLALGGWAMVLRAF